MAAINAILPDLKLKLETKGPDVIRPPLGEGVCMIERMNYPQNKYPFLERERAKDARMDEAIRFDQWPG